MTEENSIWKNNNGVIISWSAIIGIFIVVVVFLSAQWVLKMLGTRKILNPLQRDIDVRGEKVEIELEHPLDQANLVTINVAAESKIDKKLSPKR